MENLLVEIGGQRNEFDTLGEEFDNISWGVNIFEFSALPKETREFSKDLINFKGKKGLILYYACLLAAKEFDSVFQTLAKDYRISSESEADILMQTIQDAIAVNYVDILTQFLPETTVKKIKGQIATHPNPEAFKLEKVTSELSKYRSGFDFKEFIALAKKFNMPSCVFLDVITKELPTFELSQDNLGKKLFEAISIYDGRPLFYHLDEKNPEDFEFSIKLGDKTYKAKLCKKTDPTALFAGKLTKCCQFYTGDSSDSAVLPVYTDPNAGLIILKDGNKVKATCFTWLAMDKNGEISGIVIDSFEHLPEARKAFTPFITELSKILSFAGLNLYVGTGGATPPLLEMLDSGYSHTTIIERPEPLSADLILYRDSKKVYHINPNASYASEVEITTDSLETYFASLSSNDKAKFSLAYSQYALEDYVPDVIECTQTLGLNTLEYIILLAPIMEKCYTPNGHETIARLLSVRAETLKEIGKSPELIQKLFMELYSSENHYQKFIESIDESVGVDLSGEFDAALFGWEDDF